MMCKVQLYELTSNAGVVLRLFCSRSHIFASGEPT